MPLDSAAQLMLDMVRQSGAPPGHTLTPEQLRAVTAAAAEASGYAGADVASVLAQDLGGTPALVVTPPEATGAGNQPALVWFHGGGWVIGSAAEALPLAQDLAVASGCLVVDVDYRLAPEHRFPTAVDDALTATRWVLDHAGELGADPRRVAVGGDSAGGNLAAVVAQQVTGLVAQVLVYPVTDATWSQPSISELADGYLLTADLLRWFAAHYLGEADPADARVSPLRADQAALAAACPALVLTAEYDPLRDEGEAYAERLRRAGVPTVSRRFDGQLHGFLSVGPAMPAGARAIEEIGHHLRQVFGTVS